MQMKKLKAPPGATGFSSGGEEYKVKDGYLEIPEILAPIAECHGYGKKAERLNLDTVALKSVSERTAEDVANMSRGDLLVYCESNDIEVKANMNIAKIRELVWGDIKAKQDFVKKVQAQT